MNVDVKTYLELALDRTLLEKYSTFQAGYLGDNQVFIYHKPISIDNITRSIFKDFIFLKNYIRELREKSGPTRWQLAPYFPENSTFPDPIGAHVTLLSRNEYLEELNDNLIEAYKKTPVDQREIQSVALNKVVPPNWKTVKEIYKITLNCHALTEARKSCNLPKKIEDKFDLHLTFAVKFHNGKPTSNHGNENFESIKNAFDGHLKQIIKKAISEEGISEESSDDEWYETSEEETSDEEVFEVSSEDELSEESSYEEISDVYEEEVSESKYLKTRNLKNKYLRRHI